MNEGAYVGSIGLLKNFLVSTFILSNNIHTFSIQLNITIYVLNTKSVYNLGVVGDYDSSRQFYLKFSHIFDFIYKKIALLYLSFSIVEEGFIDRLHYEHSLAY